MPFFVRASGFAGAKKVGSVEFGTVGAMNMNLNFIFVVPVPMPILAARGRCCSSSSSSCKSKRKKINDFQIVHVKFRFSEKATNLFLNIPDL